MMPQTCPKCGKETRFLIKRFKDDDYVCEDCYIEKHEVKNGKVSTESDTEL